MASDNLTDDFDNITLDATNIPSTASTKTKTSSSIDLLVYGFMRNEEECLSLSMIVPTGITRTVLEFYQIKLTRFELFSKSHFEVLNDGYEIRAKGKDCSGYLIYPETVYPEGYKDGIYFWSVKFIGEDIFCFRSIGVVSGSERDCTFTTEPCDEWPWEWKQHDGICTDYVQELEEAWASDDSEGEEKEDPSDFKSFRWGTGDTITVKLDCDGGEVVYFRNGAELVSRDIDRGKSYFFAMTSCGDKHNWFQVVDTPELVRSTED